MNNICQAIFDGRLTRDAELKYTNSGTAICNFSLAVTKSRKNGDQWEEYPNYFDFVWFGKGAEAVSQYLKKGLQVFVAAEPDQQSWTDSTTGQPRHKVQFKVSQLSLGRQPQAQQGGGRYSSDGQGYDGSSRAYNGSGAQGGGNYAAPRPNQPQAQQSANQGNQRRPPTADPRQDPGAPPWQGQPQGRQPNLGQIPGQDDFTDNTPF